MNSRPLFAIIFKLKKDDFKTPGFSPLIERVLNGVQKTLIYNNQNCQSAIRERKSLVFYCCLTEKYTQNVEDDGIT